MAEAAPIHVAFLPLRSPELMPCEDFWRLALRSWLRAEAVSADAGDLQEGERPRAQLRAARDIGGRPYLIEEWQRGRADRPQRVADGLKGRKLGLL